MLASISFSGCGVTKSTEDGVRYAKFTSIDRILQLQMGVSYETAVQVLGCEPYNLLTKQADGYAIYTYQYKLVERMVDPNVINERGGESAGNEVYNSRIEHVFLLFENNKLTSIITDEGNGKALQLVMFNNTLYQITKDEKGEYIILPVTTRLPVEEKPKSPVALPGMGQK